MKYSLVHDVKVTFLVLDNGCLAATHNKSIHVWDVGSRNVLHKPTNTWATVLDL
jgi:hypothetical protein